MKEAARRPLRRPPGEGEKRKPEKKSKQGKGGSALEIAQDLQQKQRLLLTHSVRQSLKILQMPLPELNSYLEEKILSNPLLELDKPACMQAGCGPNETGCRPGENDASAQPVEIVWESGEDWNSDWTSRHRGTSGSESDLCEGDDIFAFTAKPERFSDYLQEQLGQSRGLDAKTLAYSRYLVECLNSSGYLDVPLESLAEELRCTPFDLEQALFVVQNLDPPGVGARTLPECLILQLAQGRDFNADTIGLVQRGLLLLAKNDIAGIARLLHIGSGAAQEAADAVRRLNPIPSSGFNTGPQVSYAFPEASVNWEDGKLLIRMNGGALPRVSLCKENCDLLRRCGSSEAKSYFRENLADAKSLISCVEARKNTMTRLLSTIVWLQRNYFAKDRALVPMRMGQVAQLMGLSTSTISRAVQDKNILFQGKSIHLRSLFDSVLQTVDGEAFSTDGVRRQIKQFIQAEDPHKPLSDAALCEALMGMNIDISRRTVAKYREAMGIPSTIYRRSK